MNMLSMINDSNSAPLADRMRPTSLDDFIGQHHIVGKDKLLNRAIRAGKLTSCIFYGPPGTGKTSLAHIIAQGDGARFERLNAVTAGVADVREIIKQAEEELNFTGVCTYLLLDECHRWSKSQSDSILPAMEKGIIRLIGSTTENPYVAMTPAILSRCMIFEFMSLTQEDISTALTKALSDRQNGYGNMDIVLTDQARKHICAMSGGDVRCAYNALELAVLTTQPDANGCIIIDEQTAEQSIQKKVINCDQSAYYDMLSAFCKSLRGSDPNAALFWACRMINAGVDPRIIARRLLVHSSEDVGLADPMAMLQAQAAFLSVEKVGVPECLLNLAQAITYVCLAPKSNSMVGIHDAMNAASQKATVPMHLRDASYNGKAFHNGEGYLYPHDFDNGYVYQQYLPDEFKDSTFIHLKNIGVEGEMKKRIESIKNIKKQQD